MIPTFPGLGCFLECLLKGFLETPFAALASFMFALLPLGFAVTTGALLRGAATVISWPGPSTLAMVPSPSVSFAV